MGTFLVLAFTGLSVGALYFLLASGLALIFGLMNVLSFTHGAYLAVAAYVSWIVIQSVNTAVGASTLRLLAAVALAIVVGSLLAYLTEILLIRPLYSRDPLDQLLVTTGLAFIITGVLQGIYGADTRAVPISGWLKGSVRFGGANITYDRFVIIGCAIAVFAGTQVFLRYTRHGLIVRAGVENRDMVRALGVDVRSSFTLVFTIGGAFAGLGGALAGIYGRSISLDIGNNFLLFAFIVLVIGGLGSLKGALVASIIVGLMQQYANYYINLGLGDVLAIVLMAVVLLLRPQGLFGRKERLV